MARTKSGKATYRDLMHTWVAYLERMEWQARWWFNARHYWGTGEAGYAEARQKFLHYRGEVKTTKSRLARAATKYLAQYKGN
jgi:hypothetical protein